MSKNIRKQDYDRQMAKYSQMAKRFALNRQMQIDNPEMAELWDILEYKDVLEVVNKLTDIDIGTCASSSGYRDRTVDNISASNKPDYQIVAFTSKTECICDKHKPSKLFDEDILIINDPCLSGNFDMLCVMYNVRTRQHVYREFGNAVVNHLCGDRYPIEYLYLRGGFEGVVNVLYNIHLKYYRKCKGVLKYLGLENIYFILVRLEDFIIKYSDIENVVYN